MHQVRAHLACCGAPISGDILDGGGALAHLVDLFVHAAVIRLPRVGAIEAPLPPDRRAAVAALGG